MKKLLLLIIFICSQTFYAQVTPEQEAILADIIIKKVNSLRLQKGTYPLKRDSVLQKAGKLHAEFLATKKQITHTQEDPLYSTPLNRVRYFTKDYDDAGENNIRTKRIPAPFNSRKLAFVANIVYNSWVKSPESYKNLTSSSYSYTDLGVSYNKETQQFYLSLVFGSKKYKVPNV